MQKHITISLMSAALSLALAIPPAFAQRGSYKPDRKDVYAELAKAPRKAAARRNPLEADPDAVAAGANLFDQHCGECHGEMAEGGKGAQACAPTPSNKPLPAPSSGSSPTASFAAACPFGPSCPIPNAGSL